MHKVVTLGSLRDSRYDNRLGCLEVNYVADFNLHYRNVLETLKNMTLSKKAINFHIFCKYSNEAVSRTFYPR